MDTSLPPNYFSIYLNQICHPEDGGHTFLKNVEINLYYRVLKAQKTTII
jgi:hypothetical protein